LSLPRIVIRDGMKLACQWGASNKGAALVTEKALLSKAAGLRADSWDFTGTNYFLSNSPTFAPGLSSWIALFAALQNGEVAGVTAALHQLEPLLQQ
jgi:hypothetical protein